MAEKVYQAADGVEVHLNLEQWVNHILDGHPEHSITDLEDAILHPVQICQHINRRTRRVYEGQTYTAGFMHNNTHAVVVVELRNPQVRDVITLYLSGRYYRGVHLWP